MSEHYRRREGGATIHGLVEQWAIATPSAPAIRSGDVTVTYGELDARANRVAGRLRRLGVGPETRVGVLIPRSIDAIVAFLGVLKAGAAYVPLDPSYPTERRAFMLTDSDVVAVVTAAGGEALPEPATVPVLEVDAGPPDSAGGAALPDVGPANCAYVMYTSGSTGVPKGVVVEHGSVVSLVTSDSRLAVQPGQTVAHFAPTAFDASVFEIWGALCRGAHVAILPGPHVSVEELGSRLGELRPDWLFLTTGLFHLLASFNPAALGYVGRLLTGGDVLQPERVCTAAGTTSVHAAYGPTETTVFASLHGASPDRILERVPLGRSLDGVALYVLDEALRPVPPEDIGELYIGGTGVARGYHARPALTATRFLPDPYAADPGARMYRTGDRASVRRDGEVEFHGRVDRQVKVRGFRIELEEIETVLAAAPDVAASRMEAVRVNDALIDAVRHNIWATRRLLDICLDLSEERLAASTTGTYGDILATLEHILRSEGAYLRRLSGNPPDWLHDEQQEGEPPQARLERLGSWLDDLERRWELFRAEPFDAERVCLVNDGAESVYAGVILAQVFHHANAHREQVCAILTSIGIEPPDVQPWEYAWKNGRIWKTGN
jgi:amino acid adenylation domain-containing protein